MPIKIPDSLPARETLENENIFVMSEYRAMHQDIRPLKILILNLMPTKIVTETQLLRKLSNTPLQLEVEFLFPISHTAKNIDAQHLNSFYINFDSVKDRHYDGMIITGAPVENLDFEDVDYWSELCDIFDWTTTNVHSTLHLCWGAFAGLYYHYGIEKIKMPQKVFGIFEHTMEKPLSPFFRGFNDTFRVPHSRHVTISSEAVLNTPELELLSVSEEAGVFAVKSSDNKQFFLTGHPEYDADTLAQEYFRDKNRGLDIAVPKNYFPNDDPTQPPAVTWRAHAQLLYNNWLNYYVYQSTPYDLRLIGSDKSTGKK